MRNLGPLGLGGITRGSESNMVREFFIPAGYRLAAESSSCDGEVDRRIMLQIMQLEENSIIYIFQKQGRP